MKSSEKTKSPAVCISVGAALALAVEMVLLLFFSALTEAGKIGEENISSFALLCGAVSSFVGALVCTKSVKKYALPCALGTGAAFVAINACIGSLISKSGGDPFLCVPVYLGASVAAAFIGAARRKTRL